MGKTRVLLELALLKFYIGLIYQNDPEVSMVLEKEIIEQFHNSRYILS